MRPLLSSCGISLMLIWVASSVLHGICTAQAHGLAPAQHGRHALAARDPNAATATASILPLLSAPALPCNGDTCATAEPITLNDTCASTHDDLSKVTDAGNFEVVCDVDFPSQNIYPFILAGSFDQCLESCKQYNQDHNDTRCAGFVFAPERAADIDDCYLKSSLNYPTSATILLVGATLIPSASPSGTTIVSADNQGSEDVSTAKSPLGHVTIKDVKELGSSTNKPTNQYVSHAPYQPMKLATDLTRPGVNSALVNDYSLASDTGAWNSKDFLVKATIADMKTTPHLSRDGGKGGIVNGTNVFVFCDTGIYSDGDFVGFVSSSVATDQDMNGLQDKSLTLVDHLGEWQDDVGRMRGFAPMTEGEEAYNKAVSGDGYRYAIWPESAPIPLNSTTSLLYASLVYDEVNMDHQDQFNLTYFGNTLLEVKVDPVYGPYAIRLVPQFFSQDVIPFGSAGGFRAWGQQGVGSNDGEIVLFGKAYDPSFPGVFVAKTNPQDFMNLSSYTYWTNGTWSDETTNIRLTEDTIILNKSVLDFDIVYSPKANTFLMFYLVYPPDNTFYWRQLFPHGDMSQGVLPPYMPNGDAHWADTIVTGRWDTVDHILYKAPQPAEGFIYAGGVHAGYFGDDDITNGGEAVLISWTEHTGQPGQSPESGYAHKTIRVNFNFD